VLFAEAGAPDRAEGAWRAALHERPGDAQLHAGLAHALRDQNRNDDALAEYELARTLAPDDPVNLANVASTLVVLGRRPEARRAYEQALAQMPEPGAERAFVHLGLAIAEEADADLDGAQESYEDALSDDPRLAEAEQGLGLLCLDRGDEPCALKHLSAALDLGELSAEADCQLALAVRARGPARRRAPLRGPAGGRRRRLLRRGPAPRAAADRLG